MPSFTRALFRGQKVWAEVGPDGGLRADGEGRVEIRYRIEDRRAYRAAARNLVPLPGAAPTEGPAADPPGAGGPAAGRPRRAAGGSRRRTAASRAEPAPAPLPAADGDEEPPIVIYTDGACTGNPGPMGIGVVLVAGDRRKEISEYLGIGTNNIAELTAMLRALEAVKDRDRPVVLHSDSAYAIGVVARGWKAKANQELVARLRAVCGEFRALRFVKVAGHAGVPDNERCDELARGAISRGA